MSIIVHGGAWSIPPAYRAESISGVKTAVRTGYEVLQSGGSALDSVVAAVVSMEDNFVFNAGRGSSLNHDGFIEMDAIVMDGRDLNSGAVAAVRNVRNPVKLARIVMEETEHTLIVADGAQKLAKSSGIPIVDPSDLVGDFAVKKFKEYGLFTDTRDILYRGADEKKDVNSMSDHDTVGACALDSEGHMACAVSTGGFTSKLPGRVGDAPLIGLGGYADDQSCAVACTGHGEAISKSVLAFRIAGHKDQGLTMQEACDLSLNYMKTRLTRYGGAVSVDKKGQFGVTFTTETMPWASISESTSTLTYGMLPKDFNYEKI